MVFGEYAGVALCIAKHENGTYKPDRVNSTGNYPAYSRDRGIFQINDYWHSEVTDTQAFDAAENIRQAYRISKGGTDWHQWTTRKYCGV